MADDLAAKAAALPRSAAGGRNPWLIALVVSIATFMEVLDTSIANVALDHIAGGLAVSYDESTWVLTSYLVANAIIIPASGWLASVLGRKNYYMLSVLVFTIASFLCGIANSLTFLILARVLQGAAGGGLQPTSQSMLVDSFPAKQRGLAVTVFAFPVILAPAIGPTVGGWITDNINWNWIFLINVPVGAIALFLVQTLITEPPVLQEETKTLRRTGLRFDGVGFALIGLGLGALEIFADRGQRDDWFSSTMITTACICAAVGIVGFVIWELVKKKDTLLDLTLFTNRNFSICMMIMTVVGVVLYGTTQFLPQLLQQVLGYTATNAGLAMTVGGIATIVVMPLVGFLSSRVEARWLLGFGLVVEALALLNMCGLDTTLSFWDASFARVWQAAGLPFLFIPLTSAAYVGIKPGQTSQASALLNVFRNLGGTIGISSVQTLLAQREQFHQARIVETLNPLNPIYVSSIRTLRGMLATRLGSVGADRAALASLYGRVNRQAAMLSYIDVFWGLMWFVAIVTPLVLLLRGSEGDESEGAAA
ncbi:MAG: DHA2 family efflux MFS transporter permease subunit [Caulobacteraceae bacterium]|nr:DHA2 family efflux MFS transporter permease subunit [Caulobacter sp.]